MVSSLNSEHGPVSRDMARLIASTAAHAFAAATADRTEPEGRPPLNQWCRRYLPSSFDDPSQSPMHSWLYGELDRCDQERGRLINLEAPRGNAKSELTAAYIARCACEGREPYVWLISDTADQATTALNNVARHLLDNPLLAARYPEACGRGRGQRWSSKRIETRNGMTIEAYGMGQKLRGRKAGSQRPTLVVCDDMQNDNIQTSSVVRDKQSRWFQDVVLKAGTKKTNVIVVGTSLHRDAIIVQNRKKPGWQTAQYAAIVSWPHDKELWARWAEIYHDRDSYGNDAARVAFEFYQANRARMDEGAQVLWPERESLYELMCERERNGHTSFEREKQSNPITPEVCFFPDEWFDDSIWFSQWPQNARVWCMALDPSIGASDTSDFSAIVWGMVDLDGNVYVDASITRRPVSAMVDDCVELWRRLRPTGFYVEANHFQIVLANLLEAAAAKQRIPLAVHKEYNTEKKEVRVRRLEPFLRGRKIRFMRRSPGAALLVEQLRQFPSGTHDDGPDALELLIRGLLSLQTRAA